VKKEKPIMVFCYTRRIADGSKPDGEDIDNYTKITIFIFKILML
jgi:hypothetical protein